MDTDDVAHPQGVNVDVPRLALSVRMPADHEPAVGPDGLDRPRQGQSGAAGHVDLAVVMGFHDLNVGVREGLCGLPGQGRQNHDPQREIAGKQNRHLPGGRPDAGELLFGLAGGGNDKGRFRCAGVGCQRGGQAVVGEINDAVGLPREIGERGVHVLLLRHRVHRDQIGVRQLLADHPLHHAAHAPAGAVNQNPHGSSLRSVPALPARRRAGCGRAPPSASGEGGAAPESFPFLPARP